MADLYDTKLGAVAAPNTRVGDGGGSRFGAPIISKGGVGDALAGLGNVLNVGAKAIEAKADQAIDKGVQVAIEDTNEEVLGIRPDMQIDDQLDQLKKVQAAVAQGEDYFDRFNVTLGSKVSSLRASNPGYNEKINEKLASYKLTDPNVALSKKITDLQGANEKAQQAAQDKIVVDMVGSGSAVYTEVGNPSSPVNRAETVKAYYAAEENAAKIDKLRKARGIFRREKTGENFYGLGDDYIENQQGLFEGTYGEIVLGIRPVANSLNQLIRTGASVEQVHEKIGQVTQLTDAYRQKALKNTAQMNSAEAEDYMKFVDNNLMGVSQGILALKDIKDLNAISDSLKTYEAWVNNAKYRNVKDAPGLSRLVTIHPQLAATALNLAKFKPGITTALGDQTGAELYTVLDIFPNKGKTGVSTDKDTPVGTGNQGKSDEQIEQRQVFGAKMIQGIINNNQVNSDSKDNHVWIMSQDPLLDAYRKQKLSEQDKAQLFKQMTTPNYLANLKAAADTHPESAKVLGAYAHDMALTGISTVAREMMGAGDLVKFKPGENAIRYDNLTGEFVPAAVGEVNKSSQAYLRLTTLNKAIPLLLDTRDYKDSYELGMTDAQFLERLGGQLNQITSGKATTVGTKSLDFDPTNQPGGVSVGMNKADAASSFDPEGKDYDDETASATGMQPDLRPGENYGHMGSVAEVSEEDRAKYGLPDEAYIMLKGRNHESWDKAVDGEAERGFKIVQLGNRYYSVPNDWNPAKSITEDVKRGQPYASTTAKEPRNLLETFTAPASTPKPEGDPLIFGPGTRPISRSTLMKMFDPETGFKEGDESMNEVVKTFENAHKVGFDPETKTWKPHAALEGGNDNIGWGHKLKGKEVKEKAVFIGDRKVSYENGISDADAEALLKQDLKVSRDWVEKEFPNLNRNQKDALESLEYNMGQTYIRTTRAYEALKKGDINKFLIEAYDPNKGMVRAEVNGKLKRLPGLVRRREIEKQMFLTPIDEPNA